MEEEDNVDLADADTTGAFSGRAAAATSAPTTRDRMHHHATGLRRGNRRHRRRRQVTRRCRRTAGAWLVWATLLQRACSPSPRAAVRKDPREAPRAPSAALVEEEPDMVDIADQEDKLKRAGNHKNKEDDELPMGNINVGDIGPP